MSDKTGRNSPCPCGSGKKYKKCCLDIDINAKKKPEMESGLLPHDKYIFDTKEEVIESIRAEGFEPDVIEHVDEENGEVFKL
jgi:hypothetical protein